MRLAEFLSGIQKQRDSEIAAKLQGLQPILQQEIAKADREKELLVQKDNAIADASTIMKGSGYSDDDINEFKNNAAGLNSVSSISESVNQFKQRKSLIANLNSLGVDFDPKASMDDLTLLYNKSASKHASKESIIQKVKHLGLYDQFTGMVAESGDDIDVAYGKLLESMDAKEIENKAKALGDKYYKQYQKLVADGGDARIIYADILSNAKSDEIDNKAKLLGSDLYKRYQELVDAGGDKWSAYADVSKAADDDQKNKDNPEYNAKLLGSKYYAMFQAAVKKGIPPVVAYADASDAKQRDEKAETRAYELKKQESKASNSKTNNIRDRVYDDGTDKVVYYRSGGIVYKLKVVESNGLYYGVNAKGGALPINPALNVLSDAEVIKHGTEMVENAPGVVWKPNPNGDMVLHNPGWADASKIKKPKGNKTAPNPTDNKNTGTGKANTPVHSGSNKKSVEELLKKY